MYVRTEILNDVLSQPLDGSGISSFLALAKFLSHTPDGSVIRPHFTIRKKKVC